VVLSMGVGQSVDADGVATSLTAAHNRVSLDPAAMGIAVGETLSVTVRALAPIGIYGVEYRITFDPSVLEVVDANLVTTDTIEIHPSAVFAGGIEAENDANNGTGIIHYGATLLSGNPVYGPQELGTIVFRAKAEGRSPVRFDSQSWLSYPDGLPIPGTVWRDGLVTAGTQRLYLPIVYSNSKS